MANASSGQRNTLPPEISDERAWLAVLEEMPLGVMMAEVSSGKLLWHNKKARMAARATIPILSVKDYVCYGAAHEDGSPYLAHEYPLARAVLDGEVVELEPMYYRHSDGRRSVCQVSASRVNGPRGQRFAVCTYQDVTAVYEAKRELQEAAERMQLALDAGAIIGTWIWNVTGRFTADEPFARSFGLDPARGRAGLSGDEVLASIHPDDHPTLDAPLVEAIHRGGGAYRHQYRVLQERGAYRWVEASGRVELDENDNPVQVSGVVRDITASKRADDVRDLLAREVDHRARNALVMVQSLVRLTHASDVEDFRNRVIGRVDAMARAQGLLARTNWRGGALEDLIRDELLDCADSERFAISGPRIDLPAEHVQPLTMIIHELATNAIKYGALSVESGRVEVRWEVRPDDGIKLSWNETGGPAVTEPEHTGFGSRLMCRLAEQLRGSLQVDWQASGLAAALRFRLK